MVGWTHVALGSTTAVLLLVLLVLFVRRWCCRKRAAGEIRRDSLQAGIEKLHRKDAIFHQFDLDSKRRGGYYVFRRDSPAAADGGPFFSWADHPNLVIDAAENGWSRFGFTAHISSSPSTRSSLLGICAAGDSGRENNVEIRWEISPGSSDFMQKIRLNSGSTSSSPMAVTSVIRTALPLPGPQLSNSVFPQEAYFELTILYLHRGSESFQQLNEGEKTKLIQENCSPKVHADEMKLAGQEKEEDEVIMLSIGLASSSSSSSSSASLPLKLPGSYPGSIGFNSDGSIYLEGEKLVTDTENRVLGKANKVIGCGFDPREGKVFFTSNGELVQVVSCKGEAFSAPLYPTLATNVDALVLVNLGQKPFEYAAANPRRTPNPCFIGPVANPPAATLGYDDSRELFSMGRIDSLWQNSIRGRDTNGANHQGEDNFDVESEADLFEIVLDHPRRSPPMASVS